MSLRDELLADFEESGFNDEEGEVDRRDSRDHQYQHDTYAANRARNGERNGKESDLEEEEEEEEEEGEQVDQENHNNSMEVDGVVNNGGDGNDSSKTRLQPLKNISLKAIAPLWHSQKFQRMLGELQERKGVVRFAGSVLGPVEQDQDYQLVMEVNNVANEIDNEINAIHRYVKEIYSHRFPELDQLVAAPVDYCRTVKTIGNEPEKIESKDLSFLLPGQVLVLHMTSATTAGQPLPKQELDKVLHASNVCLQLESSRQSIVSFVESRMTLIAPNLSEVLGTAVAARVMALAGGLTALSKMPACNLQVLGQQKRSIGTGMQTAGGPIAHAGILWYSEPVQRAAEEHKRNALRLTSAKCALAARVDSFHEASDGSIGRKLRAEIDQKLEKLEEPPPPRIVKALPLPLEVTRKKRGGRLARKMKERLGLTETRTLANRMQFGSVGEDEFIGDTEVSLGMLGSKDGSGRVRGPVDKKIQMSLSRKMQKELQKQNQLANKVPGHMTAIRGSRESGSGTATVAFTPIQGLEIINPNAAEKRTQDSKSGYFSTFASFSKGSSSSTKL